MNNYNKIAQKCCNVVSEKFEIHNMLDQWMKISKKKKKN